ncbi:hypothetical protein EVAR_33847_1 [Eumeta japonica]|uniref:Uncharacterized protein n=1 Tax=Eumeta variegata TaxID=151549 RepID=A0A4C1VCH8_EUMVA|nr:hypothetical protein EVAR_33847_1 [Eumeta japonica]
MVRLYEARTDRDELSEIGRIRKQLFVRKTTRVYLNDALGVGAEVEVAEYEVGRRRRVRVQMPEGVPQRAPPAAAVHLRSIQTVEQKPLQLVTIQLDRQECA